MSTAKFLILGLGGSASHVVAKLNQSHHQSNDTPTFAIADTDFQQLQQHDVPHKLLLGAQQDINPTPEVVRQLVAQSEADIRALFQDHDRIFVVVYLGDTTGTVSAPIMADIAKDMDIPCTAIVITPCGFEEQNCQTTHDSLAALSQSTNSVIRINLDDLTKIYGDLPWESLLDHASDVLLRTFRALISTFATNAFISIDINELHTAVTGDGRVGFGRASGEDYAAKAAAAAISSPLLNGLNVKNTQGLLVHIISSDPTAQDLMDISHIIYDNTNNDTIILYSCEECKDMIDDFMVVIVATQSFDSP